MKNNVLFNSSTFLPRARYLCIFILAFVLGIGQMWAADPTYDNPSRSTYAEKTFLNVAGTQPNVTGTDNYLCYGTLYMANTVTGDKFFARLSGTGGTSSSSYTYATPATGFLAASSTSATNTYGSINANRDRPWGVYFTGATQVSVLKKDNNTSSNKWVILKLYTVAANGTETLVETKEEASPATSIKVLSCATELSPSTYYKLEITSGNTSNCAIYQVSFKQPDACSTEITTQPSGATLAIGDANPELSVVATNVTSYAWKESSDGTSYDGASSLGSSASFTPSVNDAVQTKYYYCEVTSSCDGAAVSKSNIVTVNVVGAITYYTVTLNPAGGTIADATGWTLNAGNYEKEVAEGTELTLPTFTKANRTFKTWRKAGPADVESPVTVTGDLTLTAVWNATVENVIYSWESPEGTPIEVGGTAVTKAQDGTDAETSDINVDAVGTNATYKAIRVSGKISSNAWSGNYTQITTSEAIKTGDKVKVTACTTKGDSSKKGSVQMRAGASATSTAIFTDNGTYNDVKLTTDVPVPNTKTFTVPADVNTSTITMTRSQSSTNCWVTKLQIIREILVEEGDLLTVTLNYNDGGATENGSIMVASGQAVAQPANPTWAHHRFNGWKLGGSAYNFSSAVTTDITLVANWTQLYTITYVAGDASATGDAPTQVDKAATETFTVAANTFAVEGKDFVKWNDGSADYAPGVTYTVGTANVVLTAQWEAQASNDATLKALSVAGLTLAPVFAAETETYTVTKEYGAADPVVGDVTATPTADGADVDVAWDGTNKKFTITVTALDNTTEKTYTITVNEAEAPKSLSRVLFSNGFDAFIDNTNRAVKAYYLSGTAAPTATTITAGEGTAGALSEGKIRVTGEDASYVDYIVTLEAVTPNTTTVAAEAEAGAFDGTEAWVKNGLLEYGTAAGYSAGDKWYVNRRLTKSSDAADDQRVIAGWVRSYFFVGNAYKFIMTVGGNNAIKYSVDGGAQVVNEAATVEITLPAGNHMIEIVSNQSNGDCRLSAPKLVERPATYSVTYKAGEGTGDDVVDATEYAVGDEVTVQANAFTAPANKKFNGWSPTPTVTISNGKFTMPASNVVLTAQWKEYFTITYMDGGNTLGTEDVFTDATPKGIAAPSKISYEFVGWVDGEDNPVTIASLSATTTVYAKWTVFDGCVMLKPAKTGETISANDAIAMQEGSFGATMKALTDNLAMMQMDCYLVLTVIRKQR